MTAAIPDFQRYQLAFTAHLRDPQQPLPAGVSARRMAVYEEIVFNNLLQSVSACFPVASAVLGKRQWRKLVQSFMRQYSAQSPLFRDIPKQFLDYLQDHAAMQQALPPYIYPLCHYEWIELYVSALPAEVKAANPEQPWDVTSHPVVFNPTLQLLQYDYPVHKISPRKKPAGQTPTLLAVYRNSQHAVKFVEINAVTYQLMTLMRESQMSGAEALLSLSQQLGYAEPQVMMQFGLSILDELKKQEMIISGAALEAS